MKPVTTDKCKQCAISRILWPVPGAIPSSDISACQCRLFLRYDSTGKDRYCPYGAAVPRAAKHSYPLLAKQTVAPLDTSNESQRSLLCLVRSSIS
jgi:hypothetical protein